jgi:hypothetical protein
MVRMRKRSPLDMMQIQLTHVDRDIGADLVDARLFWNLRSRMRSSAAFQPRLRQSSAPPTRWPSPMTIDIYLKTDNNSAVVAA